MKDDRLRKAAVNGTELAYVVVGDGVPCLAMHGGLGVDHTQFREWLDPLGDVLRLVYYDHRANGRSGRALPETITLDQLVADADGLRSHLGLGRAAVQGHSVGGCLALEYALRHPERVSHSLLVGTTAAWDYLPELGAELARRDTGPEVVNALFSEPATDAALAARELALAPLGFHRKAAEFAERVFRHTRWSALGWARGRETLFGFDRVARLAKVDVPTLILTGGHDFFCPPAQAERLHRGIRGSERVIFGESGHYPSPKSQSRSGPPCGAGSPGRGRASARRDLLPDLQRAADCRSETHVPSGASEGQP
jgi:proline iminopeptidase